MEEVKITSVEKVKDPKRVEAGKKLAAMSRQAKEKKALQKMSVDELQIIPSSINPLAVVGVVGVVVYYKYFNNNVKSESKNLEPEESTTVETPSSKEESKPKRRELDTLD